MATWERQTDPANTSVRTAGMAARPEDPPAWPNDGGPPTAPPSTLDLGFPRPKGDPIRGEMREPRNWFRIGMVAGALSVITLYLIFG